MPAVLQGGHQTGPEQGQRLPVERQAANTPRTTGPAREWLGITGPNRVGSGEERSRRGGSTGMGRLAQDSDH
jgi:hypothetical protein